MSSTFTNLHQHSDYSIGDGYCTIDEIIQRGKELGYEAVALTDHGTTTGLYAFYHKCKQAGIKPILGMEGYFCPEPEMRSGENAHIILLAKDIDGLRNLYRLSTAAAHQFYRKPRIGIKDLEMYHEGLICTTACIAGFFNRYPDVVDDVAKLFGDDFYMEVQPHEFREQKEYNKRVYDYAMAHGYNVLVTNDSHYSSPADVTYHARWVSIRGTGDAYSSNDFYMMDGEEVTQRMVRDGFSEEQADAMIQEASNIVHKCNVEIPEGGDNYPKYNTENPERQVRDWCNEGWKRLHMGARPNKNDYVVRVERELPVLRRCDYLNYLCIIKDIVGYCNEHGILTGLGRGSVGGCCTAYLSGITQVDSIKWSTIFERFCNEQRVTPADIDVDFESDRRDDVIEYVRQKYGEVYHVRTMNYMQEKAAIKRAGQALELPSSYVNKISTNFQTWEGVKDERLRTLARHFFGRLQSYGMHASAVMVFPRDPAEWCSVEKQGDDFVCATDYHDLEAQGCLKLDMLGLMQLSIVHRMADMMGKDVQKLWNNIPERDDTTCTLLNSGMTEGCFQIESAAMKGFINSIHIYGAKDLIPVMALCRPGPLDSGMAKDYVDRRTGRKPVKSLYPAYDEITKDTYGVILYQEQVMQIAQALCGYSLGEADILRKIIGRKIASEMKPAMEKFKEEGLKHGVPKDVIDYLSDSISKSANYLFNKSHAVAYGLTSWRTAYLKANYPAYYMASLLEYNKDDRAKVAKYISHSLRLQIKVEPPSIKSLKCSETPLNNDVFKHTYVPESNHIVLGFDMLKYVGNAFDTLTFNNDGKQWIEDNKSANRRVLESIVKAGAVEGNREELLQYIDWVKDSRKSKPPFQFVHQNDVQSDREMELASIGYSFSTVDDYISDLCDGKSIFLVTVTKRKAHKTKLGKPMHFVTGVVDGTVKELVIFNNRGSKLEVDRTYLMRLEGTKIVDFIPATKKV